MNLNSQNKTRTHIPIIPNIIEITRLLIPEATGDTGLAGWFKPVGVLLTELVAPVAGTATATTTVVLAGVAVADRVEVTA